MLTDEENNRINSGINITTFICFCVYNFETFTVFFCFFFFLIILCINYQKYIYFLIYDLLIIQEN